MITKQIMFSEFQLQFVFYQARWRSGKTLDSHSGGPGSDQSDWGSFVFFFSHEGKCWGWMFIITIHLVIINHLHIS